MRHLCQISIHALRGEGDDDSFSNVELQLCISIHALRGEGDVVVLLTFAHTPISIHALRGEGDNGIDKWGIQKLIFQSTPSVGRATSVMAN